MNSKSIQNALARAYLEILGRDPYATVYDQDDKETFEYSVVLEEKVLPSLVTIAALLKVSDENNSSAIDLIREMFNVVHANKPGDHDEEF